MSNRAADHFVVTGPAIDGVVDVSAVRGQTVASLTVDGQQCRTPTVDVTTQGIVVRAIVEEVPDDRTIGIVVALPEVNLAPGAPTETCAGVAVLVTVRTSVGGPGLLTGPLQLFELRPVAVTASAIETLTS